MPSGTWKRIVLGLFLLVTPGCGGSGGEQKWTSGTSGKAIPSNRPSAVAPTAPVSPAEMGK
jgi:hypothetical protein